MNCFFGHHRSGSTYVKTILSYLSRLQGATITTVHSTELLSSNISPDWLILTNANIEALDHIMIHRGFHVIRDPRDVVVSSYFSHLHSHKTVEWPELMEHREYLRSIDFDEGLSYEIEECRKNQFDELSKWNYNHPDILEIKFEDLIVDPVRVWSQIFSYLEIEVVPKSLLQLIFSNYNKGVNAVVRRTNINKLESLVIKNKLTQTDLDNTVRKFSYEQFSKRIKGKEDIHHHYRKGIIGDWKNHFSLKHKEVFKKHWGDLLIELDYEQSYDW